VQRIEGNGGEQQSVEEDRAVDDESCVLEGLNQLSATMSRRPRYHQ
jgi:hypothetical protein